MDTKNNFNITSFKLKKEKIAKLENKGRNLLIKLTLYPDQKTYAWVHYELLLGPGNGDKDASLHLSGGGLSFEACYEPEIPALCSGILEVLSNQRSGFFFEPIDQEDFQFYIKETKFDWFSISIHSNNFSVPEDYNLPIFAYIGIKADFEKDAILDFINQLKSEYEAIIRNYPKDTDCFR